VELTSSVPDLSTSNQKDTTADSWQAEGWNIKLIRQYISQQEIFVAPLTIRDSSAEKIYIKYELNSMMMIMMMCNDLMCT